MESDYGQRRKPLFADLFKKPNLALPEKGGGRRWQQNNTAAVSGNSSSSGSSSSWTQSLLSCDSSSSGLSTPIYSELGSSGSEDGDFIGELTRQMAECMLKEDDDDEHDPEKQFSNNESRDDDPIMPPVQVYEVQHQPKNGRRRRVKGKGTESTQQQYPQYGGYGGVSGSGMQAVYLGGSGYGYGYGSGSVGTGVFLPRMSRESDTVSREPPVQPRKKKSGYPVVLIPTRVLQVLEHHFNRIQDSNYPREESSRVNGADDDDNGEEEESHEEEKISENNEGMMAQLPKEWTY